MATATVCGCFGNLRTRYKRLVDNVFPSDVNQGLVKSNMEKLTFYALSAPEKLDRIGDYMFRKMNNHLYRKRIGYVYIAMEAMDCLLLACRSSSLNLFVESFLKMVSALLESNIVGLQICASNSFIKFANIEEDTPSYHRRYEFFISRFSQLCYGSNSDSDTEQTIRLSGLKGLQGVVRKTVNDDLQANIWDSVHTSKIVPALLFNIESDTQLLLRQSSANMIANTDSSQQNTDPAQLADSCLRELVTRASFNNISTILYPLLTYMDTRSLWLKNEFPLHIFRLVMFSIQKQYSYRAIEILLSHLDKHKCSEPEMKASVVEMISASVGIATSGSIGPSILEVFNTLLKHLKISIDVMCEDNKKQECEQRKTGEKLVQNAIVSAAGAFSSILADYQRVDVMLFIILKIPQRNAGIPLSAEVEKDVGLIKEESCNEHLLQVSLLQCLLKTAESHQIKHFLSTFSSKFLDAILAGLLLEEPDLRIYVQRLLVCLLDRKKNLNDLELLGSTLSTEDVSLSAQRCSRQDSSFMRKNSQHIFSHIYESCRKTSNKAQNYKLLAHAICLLALEFSEDDQVVEMVGFVLGLQNLARSNSLSVGQQCCLNSLVLLFFLLICHVTSVGGLLQHTHQVIAKRHELAPRMLPTVAFSGNDFTTDVLPTDDCLFLNRDIIVIALKSKQYETKNIETPYEPKPAERAVSSTSIPDHFPIIKTESQSSISSSVVEVIVPKITYEDLKDALRGENSSKRKDCVDSEMSPTKSRLQMEMKLRKTIESATMCLDHRPEIQKDIFEIEFPSLFVY